MNREKFIENLKSAREERGFTQKQVAEALGVSDRTYSKWETGDTEPGIELICRLAEFYGCAATDFFAEKTPKESNPVRAELRDLTPVQAMLRTRDIIDEAFAGIVDSNLRIFDERLYEEIDGEDLRLLTQQLPVEDPPADFISNRIGLSNGYLRRCWDKELNFRLLMLPTEEGFSGLMEGAEELGELFGLLQHVRLLLPLMEANKAMQWYDYFSPAHLAQGTELTAEEADETLKAMELWGLCSRHEMATGAGDRWLYAAGETDLLWGILALARLLLRDMRERRDDRIKRGESV